MNAAIAVAARPVTLFSRLEQTKAPKHMDPHDVLAIIRSGTLAASVAAVRGASDPDERAKLKKRLPLVCWSGTFTERKEAALQEHSGLICLDLDKIPADAVATERERLMRDPHTFALFASPSGGGLKVLVRVPADPALHRHHFAELVEHYASPYLDKSGSDPARACFLSHDPELYVNDEATVFAPPPPLRAVPGVSSAEIAAIEAAVLDRLRQPITTPSKDALATMLEAVVPVNFREQAGLPSDKELHKKHMLVLIVDNLLRIARDQRFGLCSNEAFVYVFNGASWEVVSDERLKSFLGAAAERMGVDRLDSGYYLFQDHLFLQFQRQAYMPPPEVPQGVTLINLRNGTFEVTPQGCILRPADAADFLTYQLPFEHDPKATAPRFKAYLDRVLPDRTRQDVLAEYLGSLFVRPASLKLDKVLMLYGSGANGKSVFFEVVWAMLGGGANVSTYSLQSLTDETGYYRAMLANKLVNYSSETPSKLNASTFKLLASGEPVEARLPYGKPFTLINYGKLIFNTNELPRDVEQTDGFFRRFLIVPFDVTIPEAGQDRELASKIIATELSGVFNWMLAGLERLLANKRFTDCDAARRTLEQYRLRSDSVLAFVEDEGLAPCTTGRKLLKELFTKYSNACREGNMRACSIQTFGDRLRAKGFETSRTKEGVAVFCRSTDETAPF